MSQTIRRWFFILVYWRVVVHFLDASSPVFLDVAGPMPSFFWGPPLLPALGDYMLSRNSYEFYYSLPYYIAGVAMALAGLWVTPLLVRRLRVSPAAGFFAAAGMTLALLLLLAAGSDFGTLHGVWRGPVILLRDRYEMLDVWGFCLAFLPASLLSGAAMARERWVSARGLSGSASR